MVLIQVAGQMWDSAILAAQHVVVRSPVLS
jgi:hypothetical protein